MQQNLLYLYAILDETNKSDGVIFRMYKRYFKRIVDVTLSMLALIMLSPLLIILFFTVRIMMGGHAIFTQQRIGYHENKFILYKFRSMKTAFDSNGELLSDDQRLTKFGRFLRRTSLDELPQLINIIIGDMSIIGPRPLLESYLPLYTSDEHRRHDVRPGLVGLAGVNGRNQQTWQSKFFYDIYYVDHISFSLDLKIFFLAIRTVLFMRGVNEESLATASQFTGTQSTAESDLKPKEP